LRRLALPPPYITIRNAVSRSESFLLGNPVFKFSLRSNNSTVVAATVFRTSRSGPFHVHYFLLRLPAFRFVLVFIAFFLSLFRHRLPDLAVRTISYSLLPAAAAGLQIRLGFHCLSPFAFSKKQSVCHGVRALWPRRLRRYKRLDL